MRRLVGWMPVLALTLAAVVGAVIGLNLFHSEGSSWGVAEQLGCSDGETSQPQPGVTERACSYKGHSIVILTLDNRPHALHSPLLPDFFIVGDHWIVACSNPVECDLVQQKLGGKVSVGRGLLGLSIWFK